MAEAFHRFDAGDLSPDDRVTIAGKNLTPTDEPTPFVSGYVATAGEMVERMITHSDNVAGFINVRCLESQFLEPERVAFGPTQLSAGGPLLPRGLYALPRVLAEGAGGRRAHANAGPRARGSRSLGLQHAEKSGRVPVGDGLGQD